MAPSYLQHSGLRTTIKVCVLALGLSTIKAIELILTHDFIGAIREGSITTQAWIALFIMLTFFSLAIIGSFVCIVRGKAIHLAATVAFAMLATTGGLEASSWVSELAPAYLFTGYAATQAGIAFAISFLMCQSLNISGRLRALPPYATSIAVCIAAIFGFVSQGWRPLADSTALIFLTRDVSLLAVPLFIFAFISLHRSYRLDRSSLLNSLLLRMPSKFRNRVWYRSLLLTMVASFVGFSLQIYSFFTDTPGMLFGLTFGVVCLPLIGISWMVVAELLDYVTEQKHSSVASRLTDRQAKRFLKRHLKDNHTWAATVGLRTSNFTIDHDPGSILHTRLPASLLHIRSEEIQRCVAMVLSQRSLHSYTMGHRIFGALDPETSHRPCVDILKLFACLYLDASPLVERRIKGLTSLLPIIDPSLAKMLNPTEISHMIRRNQWFFHFDFDWIDQHVIHTPKSTRYDVMVSTISSLTRQAIMDQIDSRGGIGNFVWMGPDARDRLLQEAPVLKGIVEPYPVVMENGDDEKLMFIIKFEQLIPRLQRYFNLDRWRKSLMDFEPTPENERLSNLLGMQAARSITPDAVNDLLDSIASIQWRGFREKDGALQLILKCYNNVNQELGLKDGLHLAKEPVYIKLHQKMLQTVQHVGYPSQILHHAQVLKRSLRESTNLTKAAGKPSNPRFFEAWLLLSTADFTRYKPEDRVNILNFLISACHQDNLWISEAISFKAIDALANIGKLSSKEDANLVLATLNALTNRLIKNQASPDAICLLLDTLNHLDTYLEIKADFDKNTNDQLEAYMKFLQDELGINHSDVIALMSRWQEFRVSTNAA